MNIWGYGHQFHVTDKCTAVWGRGPKADAWHHIFVRHAPGSCSELLGLHATNFLPAFELRENGHALCQKKVAPSQKAQVVAMAL
jgi:hypothetical protein